MLYIRQNEAPRMGRVWDELEEGKFTTVMEDRFQVEGQEGTFEPGDLLTMERGEDGGIAYTGSASPADGALIPANLEDNRKSAGKRGKKGE